MKIAPSDARIFYEFDQLKKKLNEDLAERLATLEGNAALVQDRDDCSVELANLYNLTGQSEKALDLCLKRRFHPWEGGEGQVEVRRPAGASLREGLGWGD